MSRCSPYARAPWLPAACLAIGCTSASTTPAPARPTVTASDHHPTISRSAGTQARRVVTIETALDRFGDQLTEIGIDELSLAQSDGGDSTCRDVAPPYWVVSALTDKGEGASCLVGAKQTACVWFAGHDLGHAEQVLCGDTADHAEIPPWVRGLVAGAVSEWQITLIPAPAPYRALRVRAGEDYHLLVRRGQVWMSSARPVASTDGRDVGPERLLDSTPLTGEPSLALVGSSYAGGSGQGALTTRLSIMAEEEGRLVELVGREVGLLFWAMDPEEREDHPLGAQSLSERPHLELTLAPKIREDGVLVLAVDHDHRPAGLLERFQAEECTPDAEGDPLHLGCPVDRVDALRKDAGVWRVENDRLVRVKR
jgi:hypothetical protein